ncbi:MAG: lipopolysaccharide biosynthesis protein [Candidatus Zixiibacteriota bacterium]
MLKTSIINVVLRGLTLSSKFVLLLFIARYLSTEELGVFGLMTVTIAISLYFLGMDFYVYNTREILARKMSKCVPLIRDQLVFHGLTYIIVLPLLLVVFAGGLISWEYCGWFYLLLVLEHMSQEASRLLITLSRSNMANLVLFFRSGAWVYVAVAVGIFLDNARSLSIIWTGWMIGILVSLGLTAYTLRWLAWQKVRRISINWGWIKNGARISLPFFCATVALMGIQYADRYFLQHDYGEASVGIYTFYAQIANAVQTFVFTGITMILYPKIVAAHQQGRLAEYRHLMRKLGLGVTGALVVLVGAVVAAIKPILAVVGKPIYADHLTIFWIMLGSTVLLTCSDIPHYALYAKHRDREIIASTIAAFVVAIVANGLLVPRYGLHGAAFATMTAFAALGCLKTVFLIKGENYSQQMVVLEQRDAELIRK